ncbi:MAG: hypothetical protein Q8P41_10670 [Pseudomonadota bacterium]|nr:hypothetical protein [Pseudomonadota bacterium]
MTRSRRWEQALLGGLLCGGLLGALLGGCAPAESPTSPRSPAPPAVTADPTRPDLVLLLPSGLRADPPGVPGPEARFIDALGAPTRRFTAAYAQSAATYVSLGSLFTGRYPTSIPLCGLFMDGVSAVETRMVQGNALANRLWCADIPAAVPTLPEVLALYGYRTAFAVAGVTGAETLGRGFQEVETIAFSADTGTDWPALLRWAGGWWSENADAPRLLVVTTADTQVVDRPKVLDRMGIRLMLDESMPVFNPGRTDADPATVATVFGDVAHDAGAGLASVVGALAAAPSGRARWVFATATNGVSLIEPTGFFDMPVPIASTSFMLDRTARVPLLVYAPPAVAGGMHPAESGRVVELLDLFPTLAGLAGAVAPARLPGADLFAGPVAGTGDEYAYAEFGDTLLYREGTYELLFRGYLHHGTVLDPQLDERLRDPASQKYFTVHEVMRDPWQKENLVFSQAGKFQELRAAMTGVRTGPGAPPAGTWDDPQRLWEIRMARSHGYW